VAREFVVKADRVVAHANGAGCGQLVVRCGAQTRVSGTPLARHSCGVMPVMRQLSGSGNTSSRRLAVQHHRLADLVQQSASVRMAANCAGRSRRGTAPKVS
jgi:hypothetical protein